MATIIPNQDFKHEREAYTKSESYEVPDEQAYYFKMCGWVGGEPAATGQPATLDIHDGDHGHESEVT